jgi:hypothetical protein
MRIRTRTAYMPAKFVIPDIDDEVAFVEGTRENSINPFDATRNI